MNPHEETQRRPEDALQASELRYRRLFESAKDGILILDAATLKITDANPFIAELLGYSHAELLGKELWEIGLFKDIEEREKRDIVICRSAGNISRCPASPEDRRPAQAASRSFRHGGQRRDSQAVAGKT